MVHWCVCFCAVRVRHVWSGDRCNIMDYSLCFPTGSAVLYTFLLFVMWHRTRGVVSLAINALEGRGVAAALIVPARGRGAV